jgi:hypothetical protein
MFLKSKKQIVQRSESCSRFPSPKQPPSSEGFCYTIGMEADKLAKILWNYHAMNQALEKADAIIALGSHDVRVGKYAAQLYLDGWAPLLVMSGGIGRLTETWHRPEAELFAEEAVKMGVPKDKMVIENKSTNTQENILLTKAALEGKGIHPKKVILVQKPYMERRAYATCKKQWPGVEIIVTSPRIPYEQYDIADRPKEEKIHILVGDTQRIKLYGEKGFIIPQEIPEEVWSAYKKLVAMGYDSHLIK